MFEDKRHKHFHSLYSVHGCWNYDDAFFLLLICFDLETVQECFTDRAGKFFYVTITCMHYRTCPRRCCFFFLYQHVQQTLVLAVVHVWTRKKNRYMKESSSVCREFEFLLWFSCLYAKGKLHNFSDEFNFVVHQSENLQCHLWVLCTLYWQKSFSSRRVQTEIAVCGNRQRECSMHGHPKGGEELKLIFAWKVQSFSIDRLESRVTHRFIKSIRLMALVSRHQSTLNRGLGKFDVNAMIWGQQQQQSGEPSSVSVRKKKWLSAHRRAIENACEKKMYSMFNAN